MTELLKKAFAEAAKLPTDQQDEVAQWLLGELESDRRWDAALSDSREAVGGLADDAIAEHQRGDTQTLDPDNL